MHVPRVLTSPLPPILGHTLLFVLLAPCFSLRIKLLGCHASQTFLFIVCHPQHVQPVPRSLRSARVCYEPAPSNDESVPQKYAGFHERTHRFDSPHSYQYIRASFKKWCLMTATVSERRDSGGKCISGDRRLFNWSLSNNVCFHLRRRRVHSVALKYAAHVLDHKNTV